MTHTAHTLWGFTRISAAAYAVAALVAAQAGAGGLSHRVDMMVGVKGHGSCMPGPCLPHASVYPSPDTFKPKT
ncbi:MAG: hypothetical protein PHN34_10040, partial [Kiritimatiellae bacterium]|nr:hypothetical protein [Kiritimatiellia bacterium]